MPHLWPPLAGVLGLMLDEVLPPRCGVCSATGTLLCQRCRGALPRAQLPRCDRCWQPVANDLCPRCEAYGSISAVVRSPYVYSAGAKRLVTGLKYAGLHSLAPAMGALMAERWREEAREVDAVTAVPLHPRRERERGFNQSALLARQVAASLGLPYVPSLVRRRRRTAPQARTRDEDERRANVYGAFEPVAGVSPAKRVLLIDDVTTTGATLDACATALLDGGAECVYGLAFVVSS
jgi:ComF family protein